MDPLHTVPSCTDRFFMFLQRCVRLASSLLSLHLGSSSDGATLAPPPVGVVVLELGGADGGLVSRPVDLSSYDGSLSVSLSAAA